MLKRTVTSPRNPNLKELEIPCSDVNLPHAIGSIQRRKEYSRDMPEDLEGYIMPQQYEEFVDQVSALSYLHSLLALIDADQRSII